MKRATKKNLVELTHYKICNRRFPSFQALGGHRASHKKPRLMTGEGGKNSDSQSGLEFAIGQAGHMRRHRAALTESHASTVVAPHFA